MDAFRAKKLVQFRVGHRALLSPVKSVEPIHGESVEASANELKRKSRSIILESGSSGKKIGAGHPRRLRVSGRRFSQAENECFPLLPEDFHIPRPQYSLKRRISARILFCVRCELLVELPEQIFFLEVIAEITGLSIILTVIGVGQAAVKFAFGHAGELAERKRSAMADGLLQFLEGEPKSGPQ